MGPLLIVGALVITAILSPQARTQTQTGTATPEEAARAKVAAEPDHWEPYVELARILREDGRPGDAADALRPVIRNSQIKMPAIHWVSFVTYLVEQVQQSPRLSLMKKAELIAEADAATDLMIGLKWELPASMRAKSLVLEERAKWIERDPARKKALQAKAKQLWDDAQELSTGPPKPEPIAEAWMHADLEAIKKRHDGKRRESQQILSDFLAAHPDYGPALIAMGETFLQEADDIKDTGEAATVQRARLLETALPYLQGGLDHAEDLNAVMHALGALDHALDADHLNRTARSETLWRTAMQKYPTDPRPYGWLVALELKTGKLRDIDPVMRLADEQLPTTREVRFQLGVMYWNLGAQTNAPVDTIRKLLTAARLIFDRILAANPDDQWTLAYKGLTLQAQALRVEQDPVRVQTLKAEAERLTARVKAQQAGASPPR